MENLADIIIRRANIEDIKELFIWRNDLHTRKMFKKSEPIEWKNHKVWFMKTLNDSNTLLTICEDMKGAKIATVRFDMNLKEANVSINLNPKMRGKGKGSKCLAQGVSFLKNNYPNIDTLFAEIKIVNITSKKIFKRVGFLKIESNQFYSIYRLQFNRKSV